MSSKMPDCGSNSCRYATKREGMRTNGTCQCDKCPRCGAVVQPTRPTQRHKAWCPQQEWIPEHHRTDDEVAP